MRLASKRPTQWFHAALLACLFSLAGAAQDDLQAARAKTWTPIDMHPLGSAIHHAVMKYPGRKPPYEQYAPDRIVDIAETMLAFQNGDGGWPANVDWTKIYPAEELAGLPYGQEGATGKKSSLDNDNTWSEIGYLAHVYRQTQLDRYAGAARKGIDYLLAEQRPSGGWRGTDVEAITFNDNVMTGTLRTLRDIAHGGGLYGFVDETRRVRAKEAFEKGIRCILACQIRVHGELTAWCEQHDHETLAPIWARTFEPPSITPDQSVGVVRLLMEIEPPSKEIVTAVRAAAAWFEKVKLTGLRIEKTPAEPVTFQRHYSDCDYIAVADADAPPIWARYYDLEEQKPIFCNRERQVTRDFAGLDRERRTGMPWYGYWPAELLAKDFPAWEAKLRSVLPVLYVIGDSTAAAYPPERSPLTGWAQVLGEHFDSGKIVVEDRAKSGRSSKSFYDEGAWVPIRDSLKSGDYVLIQFGHNDSKKDDPNRYTDPATTYPQYLKRYIEETRAKKAVPILATSINRNHWRSDTELEDTLDGYPPAMRALAAEREVPLLDMDAITKDLFERLGKIGTARLFMNLEKGAFPQYPDGLEDNTHLQEQGARAVCDAAVKGLETLPLPLKAWLLSVAP